MLWYYNHSWYDGTEPLPLHWGRECAEDVHHGAGNLKQAGQRPVRLALPVRLFLICHMGQVLPTQYLSTILYFMYHES